ncbi:putative plant SNARE [Musa troglodytarum]|nr:putative plant SNARE [Musa troglodytarum]URD87564.1 putative plant SNARE [Musa troglodytarum]
MGAGGSDPAAEDNVKMASELIDAGRKQMDETDQAIECSQMVVQQTIEVGTQASLNLKHQTDQMCRIINELETIHFSIKKTSWLIVNPNNKNIRDIPGLFPPAPTAWRLLSADALGSLELLPLERLHHLPGEVRVIPSKVPISCSLQIPAIASPLKVEVDGDHPRPEVKILLHNLQYLLVWDLASTIGVDEDRERLRNTDGVRHLDDAAAGEAICHDALGRLSDDVRTAAVNLGGILARERTTTVSTPTAVRVNDDLAASQPSITMRSTDDEAPGWVKMEDCLLIEVFLRDDRLDDVLLEVRSNLIVGDGLIMLGGDQHGMDTDGNHGAMVIVVLDRNLGFPIRPQPGAGAVLADFGEARTELGGEDMAEGHQLRCLIGRIAKHVTLITGTDVLRAFGEMAMDDLGDVRRLLLDIN